MFSGDEWIYAAICPTVQFNGYERFPVNASFPSNKSK